MIYKQLRQVIQGKYKNPNFTLSGKCFMHMSIYLPEIRFRLTFLSLSWLLVTTIVTYLRIPVITVPIVLEVFPSITGFRLRVTRLTVITFRVHVEL